MKQRSVKQTQLKYTRITITLIILALLVLLLTIIISKTLNRTDDNTHSAISKSSSNNSLSTSGTPDNSAVLSYPNNHQSSVESKINSESQPHYTYKVDIAPYLPYIEPDRSGDKNNYWLVLVNKTSPLPESFIPNDLVVSPNIKPGTVNSQLDKTASKALEALLKEAAANGFKKITMSSGYRSYSTQKWWFNYYKDKYRARFNTEQELEEYVNSFSQRAGHSEHQTGLAADIYDTAENSLFDDTPAALWLAENAHKFGFILRYPKGKQHITGIIHESWHFRYVGRSVATIIYENNWTLEEYHQKIPKTGLE